MNLIVLAPQTNLKHFKLNTSLRKITGMTEYPFEFIGKLETHDFGSIGYTVAYLPKKLVKALPLDKNPRLRVDGEINGTRINVALHPCRGKWYVLVPKKLQKRIRVRLGDDVFICFRIADQDAVDIPHELRVALEINNKASKIWNELTAGKQRSFAYRVSSAKRIETRENRVEEVLEQLLKID